MKHFILSLLFFGISLGLKAQVISGQIFDARSKEPLPFVSVTIKNTTKGTSSREDGSFSITVPNRDTELIFSSLGYFPKVLKASKVGEVYLEEKDNQLNEITVHYINPAHRIIDAAIQNKPFNDPEQFPSFRYEVYHKSIVTADIDSLNPNKKLGKILQNSDLFVNESYATRQFIRPNLSKEIITASRTSGTKSTLFTSLTPLLQQFKADSFKSNLFS
jgi:CarboxypepD_reg-like domain